MEAKESCMCIFVITIIVLLFIYFVYKKNNTHHEPYTNTNIPKVIYQTYYDKSKIPQKVYDNIRKYAPDYQHIVYDDNEIINFLNKHFGKDVVNRFNALTGAHKADLFRYCILYVHGGVYLDIKTELTKPINQIFNKQNIDIYSVISIIKETIYQGIIASPPRNHFFMDLINFIVSTPMRRIRKNYLIFTKDFYNKIKQDTNVVRPGFNRGNKYNYYLFIESCSKRRGACYDGLDRYGFCCHVYDNNEKIIKTRYSDFPWK